MMIWQTEILEEIMSECKCNTRFIKKARSENDLTKMMISHFHSKSLFVLSPEKFGFHLKGEQSIQVLSKWNVVKGPHDIKEISSLILRQDKRIYDLGEAQKDYNQRAEDLLEELNKEREIFSDKYEEESNNDFVTMVSQKGENK